MMPTATDTRVELPGNPPMLNERAARALLRSCSPKTKDRGGGVPAAGATQIVQRVRLWPDLVNDSSV
jgi:hypothetical protein